MFKNLLKALYNKQSKLKTNKYENKTVGTYKIILTREKYKLSDQNVLSQLIKSSVKKQGFQSSFEYGNCLTVFQ